MGKIKIGLFSVVILCAASLIGLLVYQSIWIKGAVTIANEQYDHRAVVALNAVSEEYTKLQGSTCCEADSLAELASIDGSNPILDSLFSVFIEINKLSSVYECNVDCRPIDSAQNNYAAKGLYYTKFLDQAIAKDKADSIACRLYLYFPNKEQYILGELWYWLAGYAVFIITIIFSLIYLIKTILKQKHLANEQADFVHSMIHELKTPVATIGMSCKILKKAGTSATDFEKLRSYTEIVDEENNRIWACVDSLLQMLTINKRSLSLKKELVDVNGIIKAAVESFSVATMSSPVSFTLMLDETIPQILVDKMHVRAVIDNIIDNAIKYSPKDSKSIKIVTERTKKNVIIIIEDHGRGIARKDIKRVFNKFYRVSGEKKRGVKGFGLGLYYIKQVVTAHKGRVYVKSKVNEGTHMGVVFPIE